MEERLPDIYKTSNSVIDMGKALNLTLHDGDPVWYQLPRNEEQMTGILGYIRNTIGVANLSRFMDSDIERAQITLYFADHTSDNVARIKDTMYGFFKDVPMKTKNGEFKLAGGRIGMEMGLNDEMKRSHAKMDSIVLGAIFIMCVLAFRSVVAGLMLAGPLLLANLIAFWYMSSMNIGLSVNTLPISAVGVGVGVDFGIYLYSRCTEEYPKSKDFRETVLTAARTTGEAIVYTGLTHHTACHYLVLHFRAEIPGRDGFLPCHDYDNEQDCRTDIASAHDTPDKTKIHEQEQHCSGNNNGSTYYG